MDDGTEGRRDGTSRIRQRPGVQVFWLDAYRGITRFPVIGHYVLPVDREVDKDRFPNGLAPVEGRPTPA